MCNIFLYLLICFFSFGALGQETLSSIDQKLSRELLYTEAFLLNVDRHKDLEKAIQLSGDSYIEAANYKAQGLEKIAAEKDKEARERLQEGSSFAVGAAATTTTAIYFLFNQKDKIIDQGISSASGFLGGLSSYMTFKRFTESVESSKEAKNQYKVMREKMDYKLNNQNLDQYADGVYSLLDRLVPDLPPVTKAKVKNKIYTLANENKGNFIEEGNKDALNFFGIVLNLEAVGGKNILNEEQLMVLRRIKSEIENPKDVDVTNLSSEKIIEALKFRKDQLIILRDYYQQTKMDKNLMDTSDRITAIESSVLSYESTKNLGKRTTKYKDAENLVPLRVGVPQ